MYYLKYPVLRIKKKATTSIKIIGGLGGVRLDIGAAPVEKFWNRHCKYCLQEV